MSPDQVLGLFPKWFGNAMPYADDRWIACGFPSTDQASFQVSKQPVDEPERLSVDVDSPMSQFDQAIVFTPGTAQHHASQWFQWAAEATIGLPHPVIFAASDQASFLHRYRLMCKLVATSLSRMLCPAVRSWCITVVWEPRPPRFGQVVLSWFAHLPLINSITRIW